MVSDLPPGTRSVPPIRELSAAEIDAEANLYRAVRVRGVVESVFRDELDLRYRWLVVRTASGIAQALSAGATGGALLKSVAYDDLVAAIREAAEGRRMLAPELEQILDSVTRGLANQDIATQFGISMPSVRDHLQGIFDKLGAANRAEAVAITLRRRLLKV